MQTKLASKVNERQVALFPSSVLAEQNNVALVVAASGGSSEAFEVLVRRYQPRILRVAWRFARNIADAEDIAQQTFQKAFVHLRQFEGHSSFSTWLTRIAMNEGLMWLRKKRSASEVPLETANEETETIFNLDPADSGPNPEETLLLLERRGIVSGAIHKLTPKLRTVMRMRELAELSTAETAGATGLSIATVKARVFHGRRKLRTILKRYVGSARRYGNEALRTDRGTNDVSRNRLACA